MGYSAPSGQPAGDASEIGGIGDWWNPYLGFASFGAQGAGVNSKTLMKMAGTPVKDLPLTLGFRYFVENPFYRVIYGGDERRAWFTRQAEGQINLEDGLGEPALEWLASYYLMERRELSDKEREVNAPLGARKLYEATKNKPVAGLMSDDLF